MNKFQKSLKIITMTFNSWLNIEKLERYSSNDWQTAKQAWIEMDLLDTDYEEINTVDVDKCFRYFGIKMSVMEIIETETKLDPTYTGKISWETMRNHLNEIQSLPFKQNMVEKAFKIITEINNKLTFKELKHFVIQVLL